MTRCALQIPCRCNELAFGVIGNATDAPYFLVGTRNFADLKFRADFSQKANGIALGRGMLDITVPAAGGSKTGTNNAKMGDALGAPCFPAPSGQRSTTTPAPAKQSFRVDFPVKSPKITIDGLLMAGESKAGSTPKRSPKAEKTGGVHRVSYFHPQRSQ